jgi:hypothetical protein
MVMPELTMAPYVLTGEGIEAVGFTGDLSSPPRCPP